MKTLDSLRLVQEFIKNNKLALLYFSDDMCSVCHDLLPKVENMLLPYPEIKRARIEMIKLPESAGEFSIFTAPTILLFIDGKETIRDSRFISVRQLNDKIERYYDMLI